VLISLLITGLLVVGTEESATFNAVCVSVKLIALTAFCAFALPAMHTANFTPFLPLANAGMISAGASIFFAYVGFDAVSTAAEETRNPQRNLPIGVIASLGICTILHLAAVPLSSPQGASTVSRLVAGGADLLLQLWRAP
jgi:APA family basic amino acid/polyamine antiporter